MTELVALTAQEARIIDAADDENSGPPEQRIALIAQRARDAQSIAAARQRRAS
jgi:hypothetical protein